MDAEHVAIFRRIPVGTQKGSLFQVFHDSFTGEDAMIFMKNAYDLTAREVLEWGSLLLQGKIMRPLNFRQNGNSFKTKSKYIYKLCSQEEENLFWLDQTSEFDAMDASEASITIVTHTPIELSGLKDVPEIPSLPVVGNALDVAGPGDMSRSMCVLGRELCKKYGGIFRLSLIGLKYIVVSDPALVKSIFDQSDCFGKRTEKDPLFKELRAFRGDGLTTVTDGPLHQQSQSVLSPALVKSAFARYVPIIIETFNQTFAEEIGNKKKNVDMKHFIKKCTLRVVGKIVLSIDLYAAGGAWKTFCEHISYVAAEAVNRVYKGTKFVPIFNYKFKKATKYMEKKLMAIVKSRRKELEVHPKDPNTYDLLDIMITSPLSVEDGKAVMMSDELIRANLNTVLSAGHSTTTSMLTWTINFLYDASLGNSDYRYELLQEIAQISKGDTHHAPNMKEIYKELPFMTKVLKETLRLSPPIPSLIRHCTKTTNLGGYLIREGETIMISILGTHLHPDSWSDAETYNPYRFNSPPKHECSFIPWAGGMRQCIGREFALLTGRLALFLLMNQFTMELSPNARVREEEHLFVFPNNLLVNFIPRKSLKKERGDSMNERGEYSSVPSMLETPQVQTARAWDGLKALIRETGHQVNILAGTKTEGGCSSKISQLLLDKALVFNFKTGDSPMIPDDFLPEIREPPTSFTIIAICVSTYQGNPAPNTKKAAAWLKALLNRQASGEPGLDQFLSNVYYFVFGCGNMNWATTYQRVAKFFDEGFQKLGAKQICATGFYDESQDDLEEIFDTFYKDMAPKLMHSLPEIGDKRLRAVDASSITSKPAVIAQGPSSAYHMDIIGDAEELGFPPILPSVVNKSIFSCPIRHIKDITPHADSSTMHIEVEFQEGMKYRAGDHLVVCPVMPPELKDRVLTFFVDYDDSTIIRWTPQFSQNRQKQFQMPMSTPMTIGNIFTNLLDLKSIPTKQFLVNMSTIVADESHAAELKNIAGSIQKYKTWVKENTPISNVDVIERFPPRGDEMRRLIEILPTLKPRPYSICSSPNMDDTSIHICVGVVEDSFVQRNACYQGSASYYLKSLLGQENASIHAFIEEADETFDVPKDDTKPMIMISAGTGFAPMRSFLQERKARKAAGDIFIFFGCRDEGKDWLYSEELKTYQAEGFVNGIFVGFSRSSQFPRMYVQDQLVAQKELVWNAVDKEGAFIYVCGSGTRVGVGTRNALATIIQEQSKCSPEEADTYIENLEATGRYEQDVWG